MAGKIVSAIILQPNEEELESDEEEQEELQAVLVLTLDDGTGGLLPYYGPGDLPFTRRDIIGKTVAEVRRMLAIARRADSSKEAKE
jgi:hypothetical protein